MPVRYYSLGGNTLGVRHGAGVSWLYGDHLGSTSASSGAASTSERYYAYGKDRGTGNLPTDHRFTGQISDASGLVFMNARYYDPVLGSFISPDTVVPEPGQPEGYNRYAYANGNPLRFSDPSGHCSELALSNESCLMWAFRVASAAAASAIAQTSATIAVPAAGSLGGGVLGFAIAANVDDAMSDMGPGYPAPITIGNSNSAGANFVLPSSTTVSSNIGSGIAFSPDTINVTSSDVIPLPGSGSSIHDAKPNPDGNRGSLPSYRPNGQQTNPQQPKGPDDPKREFIDSSKFHPEKIRPEDLWPLMSETLENLDLQEVGRLRWTLLVLSRFVLDY